MFRTIVVGVDGRQGGRDAIALARALAAPSQARLVLAHAYPGGGDLPRGTDAGLDAVLREEAAGMVRAEREAAGAEGDVVALPDLHPARGLQRVVDEEDADLLVVGSSHRGPIGRVLLGDVARDVLHGAPRPVAVARHGTPAAEAIPLRRVGVGFDGSAEATRALAFAAELAAATKGELTLVGAVSEPSAYTPAYSMSLELGRGRRAPARAAPGSDRRGRGGRRRSRVRHGGHRAPVHRPGGRLGAARPPGPGLAQLRARQAGAAGQHLQRARRARALPARRGPAWATAGGGDAPADDLVASAE